MSKRKEKLARQKMHKVIKDFNEFVKMTNIVEELKAEIYLDKKLVKRRTNE